MRGQVSVASGVLLLCLLSAFVLVSAECPNGCSGNGECKAKDSCECYKNYQGNDCGDRTCAFGRAHVDTPKGDIDMDKSRLTPGWILTDSQQHPAGTYEHFSPDAAADEAHFYMECSNKGICDRATGLCQCFDGYEGVGCRRTTCPGKCSGHGTCESIRELGVKAAGTLFGNRGNAGAVTYDLWDSNSTHGCRCDPWYHGPDCIKRSCKVGVDPLFMGVGVPTYETIIIHAGADVLTDAWIRLRMFDYYGESYITKKIKVTAVDDDNVKAVVAAIQAVPNLTFKTVSCNTVATGATVATALGGFRSVRPSGTAGMSVVCMFNDNPGKMRIPEIAASSGFGANSFTKVTTTTQQGFDNEWFNLQSAEVVLVPADASITLTLPTGTATTAFITRQLIKIEDNIMMVTGATNVLTLEFGVKHSISAKAPVFYSTALAIDAGTALFANALVGDDTFTFELANTAADKFAPGDMVFFHNQFFRVQAYYPDPAITPTKRIIKLDKPFGGQSVSGSSALVGDTNNKVYKVTVSTDTTLMYKYVSECSGRGMCSYETGLCACFKGYTDDNCDTQNIIAV